MERMQHCFWCGEELGVYQSFPGDIDHCGKKECARHAALEYRDMDEEARARAADDNFDRYR